MENNQTKKTTCLITGTGGFIGAHFVDHFLVNTDWDIIGIDSWAHKGVPERILGSKYYQENKDRVTIYTHDLNAPLSKVLVEKLRGVDYIINLASMSHVDTSITDPVPFVKNNINIVLNMLELTRMLQDMSAQEAIKYALDEQIITQDVYDELVGKTYVQIRQQLKTTLSRHFANKVLSLVRPKKFIQFSTDEVYGPMLNNIPHKEWSKMLPSNPYSASKACQEDIAISYWRTYSVPLIITNTMNIIGEKQDGEKFVPKIIKNVVNGTSLTIHAQNGVAGSRFYLHARNAADAILFILKNVALQMFPAFNEPVRLNVVGKTELNNLELAQKVASIIGKELKYEFIDVHSVRPGHDPKYGLDGTKLKELGFEYPVDFDESLKRTIDWSMKPENNTFLEQL